MMQQPGCTCGARHGEEHELSCELNNVNPPPAWPPPPPPPTWPLPNYKEPTPAELHWSKVMITLTPEQVAKVLNDRNMTPKLMTVFGLTLTQIRELIIYYEAGTGRQASEIDAR